MESDELTQALRDADRAAAAPWTDYPRTPNWYPPVTGAWATGLFAAVNQRSAHPVGAVAGIVVLLALEVVFIAWYRRYRGALPSLASPPREFRPAIARYLLGLTIVAALAWLAWVFGGLIGSLIAVFAGITTLLWWYEREYARAASATRQRLA
jgi:hypothetical protein